MDYGVIARLRHAMDGGTENTGVENVACTR